MGRPKKLDQLPWTSPLRAFRLGAGLLVVVILAMAYLPGSTSRGPQHSMSLLGLTLYYVELFFLVSSLVLARQASSVLLHMVLKNTCTDPHYIVKVSAALGEIPAPIVAAVIYSW